MSTDFEYLFITRPNPGHMQCNPIEQSDSIDPTKNKIVNESYV
jgi:hypothetical protein